MTDNAIKCPKCGYSISLTDALSTDIKEQYKKEFHDIFAKREAELLRDKESIAKKQMEIDNTIQNKLMAEKATLENKIRNEISNQTHLEIEELKTQLNEKVKSIDDFRKQELELRKKARELEEKQQAFDLEFQRKLDTEKSKIQEETAQKIIEGQRLKNAEKDKQLEGMRHQIEDLKRKAEQGSQQAQGEILELEVEAELKRLFPTDSIEPVAKGIRGGDIVQKVITLSGQQVGTIIWETKRTKAWSDAWITKLKDDQRAIAAECAVIVSQALPKDIANLGQLEGIWVTDFCTFTGVATALRSTLVQVYQAKAVAAGKGETMDVLYNYLTGTQFKQRVESIVESFKAMQDDLEKEKRAIQKIWAAREQQINRVISSTVGMHGDIHGIVGASLPKIESLEINGGENNESPL